MSTSRWAADSLFVWLAVVATLLSACSRDTNEGVGGDPTNPAGSADAPGGVEIDSVSDAPALGDTAGAVCQAVEPQVVTFATDDGLTLEGDLYWPGVERGRPVLLLHMTPLGNDRSNYPRAFIDALVTRCMTVLNIDRRGAGGSEGEPRDAFSGSNGVLDAKGAVEFLLAHGSEPEARRLAIIGASNGTTTAIDFTVLSDDVPTLAAPAVVVLLSGGSYTENQQAIADTPLSAIPTQFAYPASERGWNEAFRPTAPSIWEFREYDPGAHGTGLFTANPESIEDVADFVERTTR